MPVRTTTEIFRTAITLTAAAVAISLIAGEPASAMGIGIGAAVGLFSLLSLTLAVPRLCAQAKPASLAGLGLLLVVKTPIYAVLLFFAMTSPMVNPLAVFAGVGILPFSVAWLAFSASSNVCTLPRQLPRPR